MAGLAAFCWWAEWGEGAVAYFVNVIAARDTLLTLLLPLALAFSYRYLRFRAGSGTAPLWSFLIGWLLAIPLGLALFPASERLIAPPRLVQDVAQSMHREVATRQAPWEAGIASRRQELEFRLHPAHKGTGTMPAHSWIAEWRARYTDGSSAVVKYFVTGIEVPRLVSATIVRRSETPAPESGQSLADVYTNAPDRAPWVWALPQAGPPIDVETDVDATGAIHVVAHYPGQISVTWNRSKILGKTFESLTYHGPEMKLPCRAPWHALRLCIADNG